MKVSKKIFALAISAVLFAGFATGCANKPSPRADVIENGVVLNAGDTVAIMDIKGFGTVKIKLFPDIAPKAVENFTTHSKNGYYDGLTFHRILKDFMIQGGDPSGTGAGGSSIWGDPFEDEFSDSARNFTGALSMANTNQPTTNGSQFFLVSAPPIDRAELKKFIETNSLSYSEEDIATYVERGGTPWLDNMHTVFGMIYSGMDVVNKIMDVEMANPDVGDGVPTKKVTIKSIEIMEYE